MAKKASSEPPAVARYRKIFAQAKGVSVEALAKRHGVKRRTLVWWRWEVGRRDRLKRTKTKATGAKSRRRKKTRATGARKSSRRKRSSPLLPVRMVQPAVRTPSSGFEVLLRSGVVVRVPAGFDGGDLRRLVTTLETPGC